MTELEIQKHFFRPICTKAEVERIFNIQNAADQLLKLRAETIVDHMRLYRVYRNKALSTKKTWSLEASFNSGHYVAVLKKLPPTERNLCNNVTFGNIFSNDPNGMIFPTKYGPITTISESLKFFLKFSHLAVLDCRVEIPAHVRQNALRIAIRVMLKTETMDFMMDPRGIIPPKVTNAIHAPIKLQMKFIAGHEFSHFILGHMSDSNLVEQPIFYAISRKEEEYKPIKVYNNSQKSEFEADLNSILLPRYSDRERGELLHAALLWFGCLELYQATHEAMFPQFPWSYKSHPTARERYENLLVNVPTPNGFDVRPWLDFPKLIDRLTASLREDISLNFDFYEQYGSSYLDVPNTEWRGRELIDRVDYY
ncbi:MAG: hypothetical protein ACREO7_01545 [Pseudoxanthomonas sp.]